MYLINLGYYIYCHVVSLISVKIRVSEDLVDELKRTYTGQDTMQTSLLAASTELKERDEALRQLKFHLSRAQGQMKKFADRKRRHLQFEVGDWVFLKLRPHRQSSVAQRIHPKLSPRYYGPFKVLEKMGEVTCLLPQKSFMCSMFLC